MTPIERRREGYQLEQSLRAVANGGLTGRGYMQGEQNRLNRLPHRHNDFIFAVVAEEFGLVGSVALLLCLAGLLLGIFSVGHRTRDPGGQLIAAGVGVTLGVQTLLHVAVNVGLAPTTGMTLPFVSYGGTALLSAVSMVAVVASVKRKPRLVMDGDSLREQSARLS
jgi:cell division protein FtsW (lipid II flippase)